MRNDKKDKQIDNSILNNFGSQYNTQPNNGGGDAPANTQLIVFDNECPITFDKITLINSVLVRVASNAKENDNVKIYKTYACYYLAYPEVLESLSCCPITKEKGDYEVCSLSDLNWEQLQYMQDPEHPRRLRDNLGGNFDLLGKKEDKQQLDHFPWKQKNFDDKPPTLKVEDSEIQERGFRINSNLFRRLPGNFQPLFMLPLYSLAFVYNTKYSARSKNHSHYQTGDIQSASRLIRVVLGQMDFSGLALDQCQQTATRAARDFIQAVCNSYTGFMREHPTLQTAAKWCSLGLWNYVSRSSKALFELLKSSKTEREKLQAVYEYLRTPANQGKQLFAEIIRHQGFLKTGLDPDEVELEEEKEGFEAGIN